MKLTKISQVNQPTMAPAATPKVPVKSRNNEAIANAVAKSAIALGLTAEIVPMETVGDAKSYYVLCKGKQQRMAQAGMEPGKPDVEITFEIPMTGLMEGSVIRGMEHGPADRVMRQIAIGAVRDGRIAMVQSGRVTDTLLSQNPDIRAQQPAPAQNINTTGV